MIPQSLVTPLRLPPLVATPLCVFHARRVISPFLRRPRSQRPAPAPTVISFFPIAGCPPPRGFVQRGFADALAPPSAASLAELCPALGLGKPPTL